MFYFLVLQLPIDIRRYYNISIQDILYRPKANKFLRKKQTHKSSVAIANYFLFPWLHDILIKESKNKKANVKCSKNHKQKNLDPDFMS